MRNCFKYELIPTYNFVVSIIISKYHAIITLVGTLSYICTYLNQFAHFTNDPVISFINNLKNS